MLFRLSLLALFASVGLANAAFTLNVTSPGNAGVAAFNVNVVVGAGPGNQTGFVDVAPGATQLLVNYDINVNPGSGNFQINSLQFFYNSNANPIAFTATLTETAAVYPGAGLGTNGFTNYGSFGSTSGTFNSTTTFAAGPPITFPTTNFTATAFNYSGANSFVSPGGTGLVQLTLGVNLQQSSNGNFDTSNGATGIIGVESIGVPVPPTVIAGLLAAPVLGAVRRRRK